MKSRCALIIFLGVLIILGNFGCGEEEDEEITPGLPSQIQGSLGNRQISLMWQPAENAVAYRILRSDKADDAYTEIGTVTKTTFVDTKVSHNTKYY